MKPLLVTPSILDSYAWYKDCPSSWKEKAEADLRNALNRIYSPMEGAVKRGIDFEAKVCADLGMDLPSFTARHGTMLAPFHRHCHGGRMQEVVKRTVTIDGQAFVLYGKADVLFPSEHGFRGRIVDLKTTGRWKGAVAYTSRAQHLLYIAASGIEDFLYLVAVGRDSVVAQAPDTPPATMWTVEAVEEVDVSLPWSEATERLEGLVRRWMAFLEGRPDLMKAYVNIFTR